MYIYIFPPWGLTALIFIPKANCHTTFPFCLLVQFHCPESATGRLYGLLRRSPCRVFLDGGGGDGCVHVAWVCVGV